MYKNIDEKDLVALIALPLFSGFVFGAWDYVKQIAEMSWTFYSTTISVAFIASVVSIAALAGLGYLNSDDYDRIDWYAIVAGIAIIPIYQLFPLANNLIDTYPIVGVVVWLLVTADATYISYKG